MDAATLFSLAGMLVFPGWLLLILPLRRVHA
jgi:hypothetical protein